MSKNASFAIKTNSFFMELTAILGLVVIVKSGLHLCNSVTFSKLLFTMSEMAFRSVVAVTIYPHFAHLTFQPLALKGLQEISFRFFLVNWDRSCRLKTVTLRIKSRERVPICLTLVDLINCSGHEIYSFCTKRSEFNVSLWNKDWDLTFLRVWDEFWCFVAQK